MGKLYEHLPHPHKPTNVALLHQQEQKEGGFNTQVAIGMTKVLSSMITFWIVGLAIVVWIGLSFTSVGWDRMPWPLLLTIMNIPQISMMIGLGVGQGVLNRHQELQAEEAFQTTQKSYHDLEQIMAHLDAQDEKILEIVQKLEGKRK